MEDNLDRDEVAEIVEERMSLEERLAFLQKQQKKLLRKTKKKKNSAFSKKEVSKR